jgi:hypothetical protein
MPTKRTMRSLAARSGMSLLRAARIWALLGFQGVINVRCTGRRPRRVFCGKQKTVPEAFSTRESHLPVAAKVTVRRGMKPGRISAVLCTDPQVHPAKRNRYQQWGRLCGPSVAVPSRRFGSVSFINCLHLYCSASGDILQLFLEFTGYTNEKTAIFVAVDSFVTRCHYRSSVTSSNIRESLYPKPASISVNPSSPLIRKAFDIPIGTFPLSVAGRICSDSVIRRFCYRFNQR